MSKIEEFKSAEIVANQMRDFAQAIHEKTEHGYHVDKLGAKVTLSDTSYGTYGSSSAYTWSKIIVELMEEEIKSRLREIALLAAETAGRKAKQAALEAKAEALDVIKIADAAQEEQDDE